MGKKQPQREKPGTKRRGGARPQGAGEDYLPKGDFVLGKFPPPEGEEPFFPPLNPKRGNRVNDAEKAHRGGLTPYHHVPTTNVPFLGESCKFPRITPKPIFKGPVLGL